MLSYLLEAGICWTIFYLLYAMVLQKETFFQLNRAYLLITLILGLAIPGFEFSAWAEVPEQLPAFAYYLQPITVTVQGFEYSLETIAVSPESAAIFNWQLLLYWIYGAGILFFLLRMGFGLRRIYQLYRHSEIEKNKTYRLVKTPGKHAPFSFFDCLFWSKELELESEEKQYILQHELAHIQQGHSLDVIITELISVLFWCLPPVYFYKKELRNVHEFLADAAVYDTNPKKKYGHLLLKQAQSGQQLALAHHFFHSQLKQRIIMMTKDKSSRSSLLKYFGFLPLAAFLLLAFSTGDIPPISSDKSPATSVFSKPEPYSKKKLSKQFAAILKQLKKADAYDACKSFSDEFEEVFSARINQYPDKTEEISALAQSLVKEMEVPIIFLEKEGILRPNYMKAKDGNTFKLVEEMPRFPGGEDKASATKAMLTHIYTSIRYPKEAIKNDVQGMVVTRFVISKEGKIVDPKIVRSIGSGCDEEVLRVVATMPDWIPGKHEGKAVAVEFNLPVKFKLDGTKAEKILAKADQMPRFPGCEGEATEEARKKCAINKLVGYIGKNLKYPKDAKEAGVEGVVAAKFVIDKAGMLKKTKLVKSIGYGCDEAVLQVLDKMAKEIGPWTPGQMTDGKKVSVYYTLPIAFRLQAGDREKIEEQIESLSLANFNAFPNPVKDQLTLNFDAQPGPLSIRLIELDGKTISTVDLPDFDGHYENTFDVSRAAAGTLVLVIQQGEKVFSQKVVVQR